MESLGQQVDKMKIKPGEIPPSEVNSPPVSSDDTKWEGFGVYVPEPLNDKKLYGANIDVLQTLDTIEFNTYSDGALKQTIAYIKFWGDTKNTPDVVAKEIFKDIELDSEQSKCFELKSSSECQFSISNSFQYPGVEAVEETQEVSSRSISDLTPVAGAVFNSDLSDFRLDKTASPFKTYEANFNKYLFDLPDDLKALVPIVPKPQTLLQRGQAGLSALQELKKQGQAYILKGRELLIGTPGAKPIIDTISNVESLLLNVDKILRVSGTVLNKTGQIIDVWEDIREAYDVDLDINFTDPIIEPPERLDISLSTPVLGYGLDISIDEPIYSADIKGIEISTYSCKEVLSKKEGIWQFMFNPSQLAYTYNSDYAVSDVWGTPDGKPLHWKGNNNPELQFSDILLNGYMFGRKVEYLAQGLKDLMGFNGSAYQGSPPVLEFVWGSKTFGPCVMKNLTVTENMWDAGELVGATCSFTLVAMPEWVVNDGQVDIFDPSRTPVFIPRTPDEAPVTTPETGDTTLEGGSGTTPSNSDDPVVTIKDPPKIPGTSPNSGSAAPNIKSPFCNAVFSQKTNLSESSSLYPGALAAVQTAAKGMKSAEAEQYLLNEKVGYKKWFQAIEAFTKAAGVPVLAPNSTSLVESFRNIYPNCFKKRGGTPYGMRSLNPLDPGVLHIELEAAMTCRVNLLKYIVDTYNSKCFKVKGQPNVPGVGDGASLDTALCGLIIKTNESTRYISYPTNWFPAQTIGKKLAVKIPKDLLQEMFKWFDTIVKIGLYNEKYVNNLLSNRQDLKAFYVSYRTLMGASVDTKGKIKASTCRELANELWDLSQVLQTQSSSTKYDLTLLLAADISTAGSVFASKCFNKMLSLANSSVKKKIIRCEKK